MTKRPVPILYMSGTLPVLSETFVYREIIALRELGLDIHTASVHPPVHGLDNGGVLDQIAQSTNCIYTKKVFVLLKDAIAEVMAFPIKSITTMAICTFCSLFSAEVPVRRKHKVIYQGLAALALVRRIRHLNIGHIHSHMAHVPTTIAMFAAQQLGIRFSFTGHAVDIFPERTLLKEKLKRALFINCISYWHRDFYRSIVKRPDTDYPIIRCGIDTRKYKAAFPPLKKHLHVLSVCRLVEKKGIDILISAAEKIGKCGGPPMKYTIVGDGPEKDKLLAMTNGLSPATKVELTGSIDNDAVMKLIEQSDVFALPCRITHSGDRDGIPVALMEAMALGRCVISGDLEPIRELIEHNHSGIMIPPGDENALAKELIDLANNRSRMENLGRAARKRIENEFDLMLNANRIKRTMHDHELI
ncbi:glycosyltransferase family 4 protein [uncultured Desulfosarcina sp.]|uniref:glycosyltransferase family 4 protein n=1 Tax=uncultured Desulfosarcina sp. TaxID=218289 RepID=UPI0029C705B6|nr:glycosyltransferase family 4 protein [uncultured Desulfosarcina sp.]